MKNLNWPQSDIITPFGIFLNHRFFLMDARATIYGAGNVIEGSKMVVAWTYEGNRTYNAHTEDGEIWEVRKQNCNCPPSKL